MRVGGGMIGADYAQLMARYNAWQNDSLYRAAGTLDDAARRLDRGAFFGSIHGTLAHLLWGDAMWMSRFDGWEAPGSGIRESATWIENWDDLKARRIEADAGIRDWAFRLSDAALAGDLTWKSGALNREVTKPFGALVVHFFNHQTHHRGQVHALLTAAGAVPEATDLFILPDDW